MGGFGSGRYGKHRKDSRLTVEDCLQIDISRLLVKGEPQSYIFKHCGKIFLVCGLFASDNPDILPIFIDLSEIDNRGERLRAYRIRLNIEQTLCHFGGHRKWFECPEEKCKRRSRILYLHPYKNGKSQFRCRICLNLTYKICNNNDPGFQMRNRVTWIQKRHRDLGVPFSVFNPIPPKPRWLHQKTYLKVLQEQFVALNFLEEAELMSLEKKEKRLRQLLKSLNIPTTSA